MHQTLIKVRFNEIDPYGHVNHSVYLHYFEEARVAAMDGVGQSIDVLLSQGFSIVVAEIETKFRAPSYLSDPDREWDLRNKTSLCCMDSTSLKRWITHCDTKDSSRMRRPRW